MEMEQNAVDTQQTASTEPTSQETVQSENVEGQSAQQGESSPAEIKRWKIKAYGEELDLTEPELIKYAQLGKAGQRAMEKAATLEKSQKQLYGQLREAAEKDVFAFYQVLTGKTHPLAAGAAQRPATAQIQQDNEDPRDQKLREYEEKFQSIEQRLEREDIEKERIAIEGEIADSVKRYPELNNTYMKSFVKQEYARVLKNGLDMSLEDVAFLVAQDVKKQDAARRQGLNQKVDENNKRAPVITPPASGKDKPQGGLEYAKKLAGML